MVAELEHEIKAEKKRHDRFLPNEHRLVFSHIGQRKDFVSFLGNGFSIFLLSIINLLPH